MGMFENFPYSNFHDLNLDWLLRAVKKLGQKVDDIPQEIRKYIEDHREEFVLTANYDEPSKTIFFVREG